MAVQVEEVSADYTNFLSDAQIEQYLRFDGADQSAVLPLLTESAIRQAEAYCNATFGNKTIIALFSDACYGKTYYLPFAPIRSISEVASVDVDGVETVITTGFKTGGLTRKFIEFDSDGVYKITYTAGVADPSTQNSAVKEAVLTILSENFENRTEVLAGESITDMPRNSKVKLAPFRNNIL